MSMIFRLVAGLALLASGAVFALACSGSDAPPAAPDSEPALATDSAAAAAPAGLAQPAAAAGETAAGADPAASAPLKDRLQGDWSIALSPEEQSQMDATRQALAANPADETGKAMLAAMEAAMQMSVTFTADTMTMTVAGHGVSAPWTVGEERPDGLRIDVKKSDGTAESFEVAISGEELRLTRGSDQKLLTFRRKQG
jgi:hypothetical protein